MSMFDTLEVDNSIQEESDSLGGSRVMDSDVYLFKVDKAYVIRAASKAMGLCLELSAGKQTLRQTLWMTSGEAKGCKNFYVNQRTNEKHYLPGFNMANGLCLLTVGKPIKDLDTEKKVINLYDFDAKKEMPTEVDMVTELLGTKIYAGVIKQVVDKRKKNENTGDYEATGETREENDIDKIFCAREDFEFFTLPEVRAKAEAPIFKDKWLERWQGQVKDRSTKDVDTGTSGAPRQSGAAAPQGALFG